MFLCVKCECSAFVFVKYEIIQVRKIVPCILIRGETTKFSQGFEVSFVLWIHFGLPI